MTNTESEAVPKFRRGVVVTYVDNHGRVQSGEVYRVTAEWAGYAPAGREPLIIYTVGHPTYYRNRTYVAEGDILGLAGAAS